MSPTHRCRRVVALDAPLRPLDALPLAGDGPVCLLESVGAPALPGRWSFLGLDPILSVIGARGGARVGPPGAEQPAPGSALEALRAALAVHALPAEPPPPDAPPFLGGAMGYLAYELLHALERVPERPDDGLPDLHLALFAAVLAHDARHDRSWLAVNGFGSSAAEATARADARLDQLRRAIAARHAPPSDRFAALRARAEDRRRARPRLSLADLPAAGVRPVFPGDAYLDVVREVQARIAAGEAFEVCTTQRFDVDRAAPGPALYGALRAANPTAHAAWLRFPEVEVISSSPERFLRADRDGHVESRPIKGTRPRGATPDDDAARRDALAASEKDHAENVMIVDLVRNDLGRVCAFGTVEVPALAAIEAHPFTFQLVSTVRGRLRPGLGPVDLLAATFPGGSMTGAPKVEAMRIARRLEPVARGVFSGALGYLDLDGALDLSIVIRTFVRRGDHLSFHVGGAVVADSDPADELQECLDKAHALVIALELARAEADG